MKLTSKLIWDVFRNEINDIVFKMETFKFIGQNGLALTSVDYCNTWMFIFYKFVYMA